ncbi:MAG: proprotein convertase, P, partial [Sphingobium sp.]
PGIATGLNITDAVPAGTTYVSNSLSVGGVGAGNQCILNGTTEDDDIIGADETDLYGGSFDGTTVKASMPSLTAGTSLTAAFLVKVN